MSRRVRARGLQDDVGRVPSRGGPIGWDLFEIGVWNLDLLWMLELGAWMFRSPLLLKWS